MLENSVNEMMNILNRKLVSQLSFGYRLAYYGQAEVMLLDTSEFFNAFMISIFLTFMMINEMIESRSWPFLILFTIPLGFIGMFVFIFHHWIGVLLPMIRLLGWVMMIELVVNNKILTMDVFNRKGHSYESSYDESNTK